MSDLKRCAIYTRKSTEEGLDQAFNSLDAQRESCEAYITSQRNEGWRRVKARFDDGGLSGGNTDRPGLQALLAEIEAGRIDIIVVYKVDRLTRSLADFAKLVERFDKHGVSFVSVTQQFNTSSSMGRLTLNVLLSFAQFEREVTAERIRDKIAASRKKGLWTGGNPPLGYDNVDKALVINAAEAATVRRLFDAYRDLGCARKVIEIARAEGLVTKKHPGERGGGRGGKPITRGPLYWLLANPIYAGYVRAGDSLCEGVHEAIIDRETWNAVQTMREAAAKRTGIATAKRNPLVGKLFADGDRLTPTFSTRSGRRHRYYITKLTETGDEASKTRWRVPADKLETSLVTALDQWIRSAEATTSILAENTSANHHGRARKALDRLINDEASRTPRERIHNWAACIIRIDLDQDGAAITLAADQLIDCDGTLPINESVIIQSSIDIGPRGQGLRLILGETVEAGAASKAMRDLLARAFYWKEQWFSGPKTTLRQIAEDAARPPSEISREVQLAFLAPDVLDTLHGGTAKVSANQLRRLRDLPPSWAEQRNLFGLGTSREI